MLSVTARTEESHEMKLTFCNEMQGKILLNSACFQTTTPPSIKMLCLLSSPIQHRGVARSIHRLCIFCNEPDRLVLNLETRKTDILNNYLVRRYVCTHKGNTLKFNTLFCATLRVSSFSAFISLPFRKHRYILLPKKYLTNCRVLWYQVWTNYSLGYQVTSLLCLAQITNLSVF